MEKEKTSNIISDIRKQVDKLSRPWVLIGESVPSFSVIEIARRLQIQDCKVVARTVLADSNRKLILREPTGDEVENLKESALRAAPYKRAVNMANYRSRAPGGGPVVKRRIIEADLEKKRVELGTGRLVVDIRPEDETDKINYNRREKIKQRLALRWSANLMKPENNQSGIDSIMSTI